jgi:hypothetical protein
MTRCEKILANHMLLVPRRVIKRLLSLGVLVALLLEYLAFVVVVRIVPDRVHLEICVVVAICLHQLRYGDGGIDVLMYNNVGMLCAQLSQPLVFLL